MADGLPQACNPGVGAEIFSGSNNWAVSPGKSKTGKPLLANDMHLGFGAPGIWTQIHLVIEGKLNVTGVILPGSLVVICGHNDSIAWGMTDLIVNILPELTSAWIVDTSTAEKESFSDIVMRAFTETVNELTGLLGADPEKWEWGKLITLTLNHPMGSVKMLDKVLKLNRGPFEVPGGKHTVCSYALPLSIQLIQVVTYYNTNLHKKRVASLQPL